MFSISMSNFRRIKMAFTKASRCVGVLILNILLLVTCERAKEKMYEAVNGAFCFKRLNATNEFGCTSSRSGNTGVLHIIKFQSDLSWLINDARAAPYIVMLPFDFPNFADTIMQLKNSGKVSGLILTSNRTSYSPEDVCPNRFSGLSDSQCNNDIQPWNSIGSSLLFVDFGFPILYINPNDYSKDVDFLNQCFQKHNAHDLEFQSSRPLCAVELTSHMLAAVDSRTCIRRSTMINNLTPTRYCDPLLGLNIHMPLYPRMAGAAESTKKSKSVILVVTRLDGTSMFDGVVPGAGSPVLGIVSLLAVAHALVNMTKGKSSPERNVMFVFYHGESYDYIGSSRMIYDMENDAFPHRPQADDSLEQSSLLKLHDVGLVVELDSVMKNEIFYHSLDEILDEKEMISVFTRALKRELDNLSVKLSKSIGRLPPSSLQRFLKKDRFIKGVVLSSYNSTFDNMFYHSIFDDGKNLNFTYFNKTEPEVDSIQRHLADFSLAVARSLYATLFDESESYRGSSDVKLVSLVDELLYCYLVSPTCGIFEKVTFRKSLDEKPYPLYVGVVKNHNVTTLTSLTLAWLTGNKVDRNHSECHNSDTDLVRQYFWMAEDDDDEIGVCIESYMNYSLAQSPAFVIKDYDWTSHEYSTWTESVWQEKMTARVYIKPSRKQEVVSLSVGVLVFIISFVVVYFVSTKANILFNQNELEIARI